MRNLEQTRLVELLPTSIRYDPIVSAAAAAIDDEMQSLTKSMDKLAIFSRLDQLTDAEADELAWQFHVDFYGPPMPIEKKRELVKNSFSWHRRKGTPSAVEEVISVAFDSAEVKEWFDYGGQPYHFKVVTRDLITPETYDQVVRAIHSVKNVRSVLDDIEVNRDYKRVIHVSSSFSRISYPFQAFAGEHLFAGVAYGGPAVVDIPANPVYGSEFSMEGNAVETATQDPYKVTGLIYAGASSATIPAVVVPVDQITTYSGVNTTLTAQQSYDTIPKSFKTTGTIFVGTEVLI